MNLGLESHSPVVQKNGSILTFTRGWHSNVSDPTTLFGATSYVYLVTADKWNRPYRPVSNTSSPVFTKHDLEDSFM